MSKFSIFQAKILFKNNRKNSYHFRNQHYVLNGIFKILEFSNTSKSQQCLGSRDDKINVLGLVGPATAAPIDGVRPILAMIMENYEIIQ